MKKLNQRGISHLLIPLSFIAVIGGIGAYVLSKSNAERAMPAPLVLTQANNGQNVQLVVGQGLEVKLSQVEHYTGATNKQVLASTDKTVPSSGPTIDAHYRAVATGTSQILAVEGGEHCNPTPARTACSVTAGPALVYHVNVTVVPLRAPINSYITGHVYLQTASGPACGYGCKTNRPTPYQATLQFRGGASGALIQSVRSKSDGSFSVKLAAGAYKVVPLPSGVSTASPQTVTLQPGQTATITVMYTASVPVEGPPVIDPTPVTH